MNTAVSHTGPVPDRFITSLNYSELHAMTTAGVGVPVQQLYRANSLFDPNLSGIGHQPLGHDELATLYTKYTVTGISYRVTFTNQSTTDYAEVAVVVRPNNVAYTLMDTVFEAPYVQRGVVGPETGAQNIKAFSGTMSIAKIRGVPERKVLDESDYSALFGANPWVTPTLQLYAENQNTLAAITVNARVEIKYHTQIFDRKVLIQS